MSKNETMDFRNICTEYIYAIFCSMTELDHTRVYVLSANSKINVKPKCVGGKNQCSICIQVNTHCVYMCVFQCCICSTQNTRLLLRLELVMMKKRHNFMIYIFLCNKLFGFLSSSGYLILAYTRITCAWNIREEVTYSPTKQQMQLTRIDLVPSYIGCRVSLGTYYIVHRRN